MTVTDLLRSAVQAQQEYALRSSLALTGIAAGVASVLLAFAATTGARDRAIRDLGDLGPDIVAVRAASDAATGVTPVVSGRLVRAIQQTVAAAHVAPVRRSSRPAISGQVVKESSVIATSSQWPSVSGVRIASGRWIDQDDERWQRRVVVLGATIAEELDAGSNASDTWIKLGADWFLAIGILAPRGSAGVPAHGAAASAGDVDRTAFVPLPLIRSRRTDCADCVDEILIRSNHQPHRVADAVAGVIARVEPRIDRRAPGYELIVAEELLRAKLMARRSGDALLAIVGLLALVVGGAGITTILLAHVKERTVEIGVRRAVGATKLDIVRQIAIEAVLLCAAGAMSGIVIGALAVVASAAFAGWDMRMTPGSVAIALAAALVVSLAAAIVPARRASALTPAAALREE